MTQKHALIIGNSDYQDGALARLAMPIADVGGLAAVLRDPHIGAFDDVKPLVNISAAQMRLEIESFFADKTPDDLLLLYFTGHGVRDDQGQLYFAVNDTLHNRLRATAVPAAFVTGEMDRSRSRRQVLILDCCHSGSFAQGSKAMTGESVGTKAAFEGTGYGRVVLTATDATQYAWEGDQIVGEAQNSVFTLYLLQGLRTGEADTDGDGTITLDELYDYVYEKVVAATPRQTPGKWSYRQQGEIVVANNPRPAVKPGTLPDDLQQSIDDVRAWVREGAIGVLNELLQSNDRRMAAAAHDALVRLRNDDSRKVASAAAAALSAREARSQVVAPAPASEPTVVPPATENAGVPLEAARPSAEQPEAASRLEPPVVTPSRAMDVEGDQAPLSTRSRAMIVVLVGWGLAALSAFWFRSIEFTLDALFGSNLVWTGLAGVSTALALRLVEPRAKGEHLAMLVAGWLVGGLATSFVHLELVHAEYSPADLYLLIPLINGTLGGLVTAIAVRLVCPHANFQALGLILAGWIVGAILMGMGVSQINDSFLVGLILIVLGGLIGGGATVWVVEGARERA